MRLDESQSRLNTPSGELLLDQSALKVLGYLVRRAGEVCSSESLLAAGWPGRVVTVNSLNKCIGRLRRAMGDEAGHLQAVHGYGYRLLAEPVMVGQSDANPQTHAVAAPAGPELMPTGWRVVDSLGSDGQIATVLACRPDASAPEVLSIARSDAGIQRLKRWLAAWQRVVEREPDCSWLIAPTAWDVDTPPAFVAYATHEEGSLIDFLARVDEQPGDFAQARLQLAEAVCEAVSRLHQLGLSHGALQPRYLIPRIDDTGRLQVRIAGLGDARCSGKTLGAEPAAGGVALATDADDPPADSLALPYRAPELRSGQLADIPSDVFSLGVLVFQILAGDLQLPLAPGWQQQLDDPLLAEDIERAAHIEPAARFASAGELLLRLQRLGARRAERERNARLLEERRLVEARLARHQQWLRAGGVAAAGLALALLIALGSVHQANQATQLAEANAAEASAVKDFFTRRLLAQADPYRGSDAQISLKQALDAAAESIERDLGESPRAAAAIHHTVADVFEGWGDYQKSLGHLRLARDHSRRLGAPARSQQAALERQLCDLSRRAGDLDAAGAACAAAIRLETALAGAPSAETEVERAKVEYETGECASAVERLQPIIAAAPGTRGNEAPRHLIHAHWFAGLCHARLGNFASSEHQFDRLIALQSARLPGDHPALAWAHMDFAETLIIAGDFTKGEQQLEKAERIFRERLHPGHVDNQLATYHRARIALWSGQFSAAARKLDDVLAVWQPELGDQHLWTLYTRAELAWALAEDGDTEQAARLMDALTIHSRGILSDRPQLLSFFEEMAARVYLALQRYEQAAGAIDRLRQAANTGLPETHPRMAVSHCLAAELALARGNAQQARRHRDACAEGLAALPESNYRVRWLRQLESRLPEQLAQHTDL